VQQKGGLKAPCGRALSVSPRNADDHVTVALRSASGAIVPIPCCEETLDIVQHDTVVIRLGEGGSLLADVASLFGGCRDCSGQNKRVAISSEAGALFSDFGGEAYAEACRRASEASSDSLARDWSVVAATIARRSGMRSSVLDALFG
jgi:hypothetical protein